MRTGRSRRTEDADTVDEGGAAAARVSEWKAAAMRTSGRERAAQPCLPLVRGARGFFIFLFFIFVFYKNIFSIWKFTGIYPAAPLPGGRDLAARQRGGRGISEKNFVEKIARRSLGAGHPTAGRPALAARLRGDRP